MSELNNVLQRTFVREFYRLNAMFFLIIIGVAFGFMRDTEHKAIAAFITSSPVWTLVPTVLWSLYGFKICSFNDQVCKTKEMNFIHGLSLLPISTQLLSALRVAFNQFLPAIAYGSFLIATAVKNNIISSVISLIAVILIQLSVITYLLYRQIEFTHVEARVSFLKDWSDKNFQKSFTQFFTEWLARSQPGMLVTIKIFACVMIFAVCQLYRYDDYDYRLLAMGSLVAFATNLVFTSQFILFENHIFSMMRNLPLPMSKRIFYFFLSMLALCLPELILLTRNFPRQLHIYQLLAIVLFGFSIFLLGYSALLRKNNGLEELSGTIFLSFIALIILILFSIPLLLISAIVLLLALYRLPKNFYEFELLNEKAK